MIAMAISKKGLLIAYIALTYQQARDIAWAMLKSIGNPSIKTINESRLEVIIKTQDGGTSTISLRGWESIETMRGMKVDFFILDEVSSYRNFWENWQEVLRPTLTDTKGSALFISTPKGYNHFYELAQLELTDKDYKSFHFTSYDNPYLPVEELDKAKSEMTEDRFAQEYMADFRKTEGLVYKEFNRDFHLVDKCEEIWKAIICGVDFGYTNPAAIIKIGLDRDNNYWIMEEFYKVKQTTEELIDRIKSYAPNMVYPDPAEPDRIEMIRKAGFNCREVSKDIKAGIDNVREMFKQNRIKIHKSCVNLIRELEVYSYPDEGNKEIPIKENDHLVDALRYAIYSYQPMNAQSFAIHYPNLKKTINYK